MSTIQCALYCKIDGKYCSHPLVYAMWTVVAAIYNVITPRHIQASIFNWSYLRSYCRYLDNTMCVILQNWCQILRICPSLRYEDCGPGHIQCIYSSAYSVFSIKLNVSALLLEISRQFNARYTVNLVTHKAHMLQYTLSDMWSQPYTMNLQLLLFKLQYSAERISAAIGDM
jgi:hypothetical protein